MAAWTTKAPVAPSGTLAKVELIAELFFLSRSSIGKAKINTPNMSPPSKFGQVEKECIMPTFLPVAWLSAVMAAQHGGSCACQAGMWTHIQPAGKS